jgi:hypothetical protein
MEQSTDGSILHTEAIDCKHLLGLFLRTVGPAHVFKARDSW